MVGLAAVVAVGVEIGYFFYRGQDSFKLPDVLPPPVSEGNTEVLADVLFRQYLLPFEIASILLLVAVVGSVVMAKKRI
jgi:NADH-quinone oxidoreductase subunit J